MFTGLVQAVGVVVEAREHRGLRLGIRPEGWDHEPSPGSSISVSGVCLTLAEPSTDAGVLAFDVVEETLAKTTLGGLRPGARVNLERSLTVGDLLGGHLVQGHVDGVGLLHRVQAGADYRLWIQPGPTLMEYIVPKGSIAVDGVSLTIAAADPGSGLFEIALIPTTLAKTTLGRMQAGDRCNLETDIMAKTIVHYLRHFAPPMREPAGGR